MAASISALFHQPTNQEEINSANPLRSEAAAAPANGADSSAGISANDFLTLLVTEMKNQDPTAQTDPNEYINQLVQVNSLEQLISINEKLSSSSTQAPTGKVIAPGRELSQPPGPLDAANQLSAGFARNAQGVPSVSGNLTIPTGSAAAQRVAAALSGHLN